MTQRSEAPDTSADAELRRLLDAEPRGGFILVAGAGSGKTTSLVKALAHVIAARGDELQARTQQVACITYTEIAAREIQDDVGNSDLVHVSTIHSFLWRVVKPFHKDIAVWVEAHLRKKLAEAEAKQANSSSRTRASVRDSASASIERYRRHLDALPNVTRYRYGVGADYRRGILGHSDILAMVPDLIMERPLLARLVAAQFPYIFVDESQDTFKAVVESLKHVERLGQGKVCLGFFGDPMQQIYQTGVGEISPEPGWVTLKKPENFRSAEKILTVINRVRADADGLTQVSGLPTEQRRSGEVYFFVLPADNSRTRNLERVRNWLTEHSSSGGWMGDAASEGAKILMIVHKMAARRLGFLDLYNAFHLSGSRLRDAFDEGSAWPLTPFMNVIMPLCSAGNGKPSSEVAILRKYSTVLSDESLGKNTLEAALSAAREAVTQLRNIVAVAGAGSVGRALRVAFNAGLIDPDPRLSAYLYAEGNGSDSLDSGNFPVLDAFMRRDVAELWGYIEYLGNQSPYSTQHGTKGSEFPRVIVVIDDDEGQFPLYSYEKLLGLRELSTRDEENQASGSDSVIERTRRLLYVCISRAMNALAVVLFAADVEAAIAALKASGLPGTEEPLTLNKMSDQCLALGVGSG